MWTNDVIKMLHHLYLMANESQTHWTPITGEASLPTDDEALCLFAEWEGGIMKDRWIVKWKVAKTDINHHLFTHYTILTTHLK